jgi:hypothetical protein
LSIQAYRSERKEKKVAWIPKKQRMKKKNYCVRVDIAIPLPCFDTQGVFLTPNSPAQPIISHQKYHYCRHRPGVGTLSRYGYRCKNAILS